MAASEKHFTWFDPDPQNPATYYQKLIVRRQEILALDCNTRGKMQQEWISLIVEMDAVMRVCHTHLGTVEFNRPRTRSFRGESFMAGGGAGHAALDSRARLALSSVSTGMLPETERVAIGYLRLPVTAEACKEARGQTLQRPVVLRQFWRHPAWPDPDPTFIWQHRQPRSSDDGAGLTQQKPRAVQSDAKAGPAHPRSQRGPQAKSDSSLRPTERGLRSPLSKSKGVSNSRALESLPNQAPTRIDNPTSRASISMRGTQKSAPKHSKENTPGSTLRKSSLSATVRADSQSRDITPSPPQAGEQVAIVPRQLLPVTVDL